MNIEQAKRIPMSEILEKLNVKPEKENDRESWYLSPLRRETNASFKINKEINLWYDFGIPHGGDTVEFVCRYLKSTGEDNTVSDALRWIKNITGTCQYLTSVNEITTSKQDHSLVLKHVDRIKHVSLIRYLEKRGVSLNLAYKYLKEVRVFNKNTEKQFFALGFKNEEEGFELRNSLFKGSIGKKAISFIRGNDPKTKGFHLFEGFMDYLSALEQKNNKIFNEDVIVLNSLACLKQIIPYIKYHSYTNAYTWLDNDDAGNKATTELSKFFSDIGNIQHIRMNNVYSPYMDVNDWHQSTLKFRL